MKALVCDTGPLLAALNERDKHHAASVALFDGFEGILVVPSLIVTEVCYLAQTQIGRQTEIRFLESIVAGELTIEHPIEQDWARITQLVRQYVGFPSALQTPQSSRSPNAWASRSSPRSITVICEP